MQEYKKRIDTFVDKRKTYMNLFTDPQVKTFRELQQSLKEDRRFILALHESGKSKLRSNFNDFGTNTFEIEGENMRLNFKLIKRSEIIINPYSYISEQGYSQITGPYKNLSL